MTEPELTEPQLELAPASTPEPPPPVDPVAALPPITSAVEWRKRARGRWLITLPSGVTVKAKRPDFSELIGRSVVKLDELMQVQMTAAEGEAYFAMVGLAQKLLPFIVLDPPIVQRNGATHDMNDPVIVADEVPNGDAIAVLLWGLGLNRLTQVEVTE